MKAVKYRDCTRPFPRTQAGQVDNGAVKRTRPTRVPLEGIRRARQRGRPLGRQDSTRRREPRPSQSPPRTLRPSPRPCQRKVSSDAIGVPARWCRSRTSNRLLGPTSRANTVPNVAAAPRSRRPDTHCRHDPRRGALHEEATVKAAQDRDGRWSLRWRRCGSPRPCSRRRNRSITSRPSAVAVNCSRAAAQAAPVAYSASRCGPGQWWRQARCVSVAAVTDSVWARCMTRLGRIISRTATAVHAGTRRSRCNPFAPCRSGMRERLDTNVDTSTVLVSRFPCAPSAGRR
jgi:hypothetical protein